MRAENDFAAVSDQLLDSGQSGGQTVGVGDNAVLERYVEVAANKNFLAFYIDLRRELMGNTSFRFNADGSRRGHGLQIFWIMPPHEPAAYYGACRIAAYL